jgi:ribonuclease R
MQTTPESPLSPVRTALSELLRDLVSRAGVPLDHPPEVHAEAAHFAANPGIDDPELTDLRHLPFVTIDARTSKDLDQALFLATREDGLISVYYALADAAYYVRPGSALFAEALKRGASFYLPGYAVPMLPRALSEGVVSLNEGVDRRALVFETTVARDGSVQATNVYRARISSRAKLAFDDVQDLYDGVVSATTEALAAAPYAASLGLLRVVGEARVAEASHRDVVRYRRSEIDLKPDGGGFLYPTRSVRKEVELYNEQLSLLCNAEGARILRETPPDYVQPLYRIHPPPDDADLERFPRFIAALVAMHGLPKDPWLFPDVALDEISRALAGYLRRLPEGGPTDGIARAIHRQAVILNQRSQFVSEPSAHFGVGASSYARFSAPMRELVGIFLHKEMTELLTQRCDDAVADRALRDQVVAAGNASKDLQRSLDEGVRALVHERIFGQQLPLPVAERTRFSGTVLGLAGGKIHVELETPALDVKVFFRDLGIALAPAGTRPVWLEAGHEGAALLGGPPGPATEGKPLVRVGDSIAVVVTGLDEKRNRWILLPDFAV